jgi:hypothetical protein
LPVPSDAGAVQVFSAGPSTLVTAGLVIDAGDGHTGPLAAMLVQMAISQT